MAGDFAATSTTTGAWIRRAALRAARSAGEPEALAAAEKEAVIAALHVQRRLGMSAVGDGQFRREHFESVVFDHVEGFGPAGGPQPLADAAGIAAARRRSAPAAPAATGRLADAEAATPLASVERPVFVVLPSAGYLAAVGSASGEPQGVRRGRRDRAGHCHTSASRSTAASGVAYMALGNQLYRR